MENIDVVKLPQHEGRTIILGTNDEGQTVPALVNLVLRPSTTAHGRVKALLTIEGPDGKVAPLPFAQAVVGRKGGWTPEFRLEQN